MCWSPNIGSSQQSIQLLSPKREPESSFCHYDDAKGISFCYLLKSYIKFLNKRASLIAQLVKIPPAIQETPVQFLFGKDLLEKG